VKLRELGSKTMDCSGDVDDAMVWMADLTEKHPGVLFRYESMDEYDRITAVAVEVIVGPPAPFYNHLPRDNSELARDMASDLAEAIQQLNPGFTASADGASVTCARNAESEFEVDDNMCSNAEKCLGCR